MAYVPPKYPGAIPTAEDLPDRTDDIDWLYAARYNELKKELRAALIELGTLPKGAHADVKTRLDILGPGDVIGPASALDEAIARYDETSGKLIQATLGAKIDDTGRLTNTAQPAFNARANGTQANIAKDTSVTIIWHTEIYDIGNNFAANVFTAPVTGKYLLCVSPVLLLPDSATTNYQIMFVTSNRIYRHYWDPRQLAGDPSIWTLPLTMVVDLDVNDTAYVVIYQTGGTAQTDISAEARFSGMLVC